MDKLLEEIRKLEDEKWDLESKKAKKESLLDSKRKKRVKIKKSYDEVESKERDLKSKRSLIERSKEIKKEKKKFLTKFYSILGGAVALFVIIMFLIFSFPVNHLIFYLIIIPILFITEGVIDYFKETKYLRDLVKITNIDKLNKDIEENGKNELRLSQKLTNCDKEIKTLEQECYRLCNLIKDLENEIECKTEMRASIIEEILCEVLTPEQTKQFNAMETEIEKSRTTGAYTHRL